MLRPTENETPWYGGQDLWVNIPRSDAAIRLAGGGYSLKFGSVTLNGQGQPSSRKGPPVLTAMRAGGSSTVRGSTGGYSTAGDPASHGMSFWPTTINLPVRGCWLFTETLRSTTIRFLLPVP